jgi:cytosine/adenosine deaminase-related metal-dependent hydrolase
MPGMVNTHTHISMAAFRGACEDIPNRLTKVIFPLERDLVTRDLTYWSALYCLAEMARSGTTTFADMYYFEDEVAKATDKAGLRAILGETVLGHARADAPKVTAASTMPEISSGTGTAIPASSPASPPTLPTPWTRNTWLR